MSAELKHKSSSLGMGERQQDDSLRPPKAPPVVPPLPNYTLATVCPACDSPTYRLACKVRCPRCGFTWDCSEL